MEQCMPLPLPRSATPEDTPPHEEPMALASLYEKHAQGLLAYLCGKLRDPALAEDVLHDTFAAYFRQSARHKIHTPVAYLYKSARRLALNAMRDRDAQNTALAQMSASSAFAAQPGVNPLLASALREALQNLPDEQRDVLILRTYGGLTFQEIADSLEVPLSTVFKQHARAIERIREVLDDE
jgi:RNA polymerase sigma factor (sigma-70 family)